MRLILALLLLAPALFAGGIAWNYDHPRTGIVFEVWRTPSLAPPDWCLVATTSNLFYLFDEKATPMSFFRVRALDVETGMVSDWATTGK